MGFFGGNTGLMSAGGGYANSSRRQTPSTGGYGGMNAPHIQAGPLPGGGGMGYLGPGMVGDPLGALMAGGFNQSYVDPATGQTVSNNPLSGQQTRSYQGNGFSHQFSGPADYGPLLMAAFAHDAGRTQNLADQQWLANQQQIGAFGDFVRGIGPQQSQLAGQAFDMMTGEADDIKGLATARQDQVAGYIQDGQEDLEGRIADVDSQMAADQAQMKEYMDRGLAEQKAAASKYEQAIGEFEDRSALDVQNAALGIRRNAESRMKMLTGGMNPDGSPMTPEQQMFAFEDIKGATERDVFQAVTPMLSRYNEQKIALESNLASMEQAIGQATMNAGQALGSFGAQRGSVSSQNIGTLASFNASTANTLVDAFRQEGTMHQFAANLASQAGMYAQSAILQAQNLEMQGRTQLAQFVQQNPRSHVSMFQGILAMISARSAANAGG